MGQSITNFDAVLKEFYEAPLRDSVNQEVLAFQYMERSSRQWAGRRVVFPVHLRRGNSIGSRPEGGTLPTASQQVYQESRITAAYNYCRIQVTGQVLAASKLAFAEALSSEMMYGKDDLVFDLARQSYGDGKGTLAQVGAASDSSTAVTVFNQFAEPGQNGARYIQAGDLIDAGTVADNDSIIGDLVVSTVSIAANSGTTTDTVTFTSASALLSQCETYLFRANIDQIEMIGFRALIDDQTAANHYGRAAGFYGSVTVQNINANTYKKWNANVVQNSAVEWVLDSYLMQKALDTTKKASGKEPDIYFGEYDVVSALLDSVSGDRRFNSPRFDAGSTALTFNGIPLVRDLLAPYNELYLMNKECMNYYVLRDVEWADDDGSVLSRVSGKDTWEGFIRVYSNLGVERRNGLTVIRDIKTQLG